MMVIFTYLMGGLIVLALTQSATAQTKISSQALDKIVSGYVTEDGPGLSVLGDLRLVQVFLFMRLRTIFL